MSLWPYLSGGALLWYCVYNAGIHASIAGVMLAFAIPFSPRRPDGGIAVAPAGANAAQAGRVPGAAAVRAGEYRRADRPGRHRRAQPRQQHRHRARVAHRQAARGRADVRVGGVPPACARCRRTSAGITSWARECSAASASRCRSSSPTSRSRITRPSSTRRSSRCWARRIIAAMLGALWLGVAARMTARSGRQAIFRFVQRCRADSRPGACEMRCARGSTR